MLSKMKNFWYDIIILFFLLLIYLIDKWDRLFKRKTIEPYEYGTEIIDLRRDELSKEIQRIANKYDVSYDVADSISKEINDAHKRIRTKTLFDAYSD